MSNDYPAADYIPIQGSNGVSYSQRLFSEEVAIAASLGGQVVTDTRQPGYEFSNGTKFDTPTNPYA